MPNTANLVCDYCNSTFVRTSKDIASSRIANSKSKFCSRTCMGLSNITTKTVTCLQCNKLFQKQAHRIKKSPNHFCDRSCSAKYHNVHKTIGTRRSKLEIFLESKLRKSYPELKLLCNDKSAINSELDFYFPELQLAIELNGILHFEPIYGNSKLTQIQSNDTKKSFLCHQQHINLAVIDCSTYSHLTEKVKNKYWNIVNNLLANMAGNMGNDPT